MRTSTFKVSCGQITQLRSNKLLFHDDDYSYVTQICLSRQDVRSGARRGIQRVQRVMAHTQANLMSVILSLKVMAASRLQNIPKAMILRETKDLACSNKTIYA